MNKFIKKNKTLLFNLIETIDSKKIEILAKNFKKFKSSKNNKLIFWATVEAHQFVIM